VSTTAGLTVKLMVLAIVRGSIFCMLYSLTYTYCNMMAEGARIVEPGETAIA
jgi:hypothetical protein